MINLKLNKLIILALSVLFLSACTSFGSYIISHPDVYLSEAEFINIDPKDIGFTKDKFCSASSNKCIPYLFATSYQPSDFPKDGAVYYSLHSTGNGVENTISHRMPSKTFNRFKGTAVLLHGYGGKKEVMIATAIYFRAIGMNVIVPDLFGHGESKENFVFAAREHEIIEELLTDLESNSSKVEPVVVVGHSMGALSASNLLLSDKVSAAILLAPMMRFDLAAKQYFPYKAPILNKFFANHIDNMITQAMNEANVTLPETDLLSNTKKSNKPILLVNSNVDPVSEADYFSSVKNDNVKNIILKERSHSSLMVFSKEDANIIEKWLVQSQVFLP